MDKGSHVGEVVGVGGLTESVNRLKEVLLGREVSVVEDDGECEGGRRDGGGLT